MIKHCLLLMAISGLFLTAKTQQQLGDPRNLVPPSEFMRILVPPVKVEGSFNLFPGWQRGEVFLSQGKFASGITFNYDVLNHSLLVQVEGKVFSLNPVAVDSIYVTNTLQVLVNPIILDGVIGDLLLLRIYDSPHSSLFRKTTAAILKTEENKNELVFDHNPDIQIEQEQYYLLLNKGNNQFSKIQGRKKELKDWEHGEQVTVYVKRQNLDLQKEADLVQVVRYHDELMLGLH